MAGIWTSDGQKSEVLKCLAVFRLMLERWPGDGHDREKYGGSNQG